MFKDYNKYLSTSLKVYLFVLLMIIIMKFIGLDCFGLDIDNPIIINIESFLRKTNLIYVLDFITLYIMFYVCFSIICNTKKVKILSLISTIVEMSLQLFLVKINKINELKFLVDTLIILIGPIFVNKKFKLKKPIIMILVIILYQLLSYLIRNQRIVSNYDSKVMDILLNIDQYIMLILTYKVYFMKGDVNLCLQEVFSSSLKKINLKNLQKKLQKSLHNFKQKEKVEKITIIIYFILSMLWNTFTLLMILLIGKLNHTFIECIFIVTSFWVSKIMFKKAFHLSSMIQCFIVSNLTYYALNKITTPLGISIFVPVLLGVGLSYVTSKFVKQTYKPLYKGMPEEVFEETILKVTDKNTIKYKVCYDFYIQNKSDVALSFKYNYSVAGIRKIKSRINEKIKGL